MPPVALPIRRKEPKEVRNVELLRLQTQRTIRKTLPGPFTMSTLSTGNKPFPLSVILAVSAYMPVKALADTGPGDHAYPGDLGNQVIEEIFVYGRAEHHIGTAATASEGLVGYADFQLPPLLRVGELVEAMPGMVATQHSGTGKANQYFLRGFNLDHGTDFSAHLDGVPLNMRSHGHGQGYLDLNFLIPELVATAVYRKGVHHAEKGDFSSAGSIDFAYYDRLPEGILEARLGEHGYGRGVMAGSVDLAQGSFTGALDVTAYAGPWQLEENLQQTRLYLGHTFELAGAEARIAFHGYDGSWNATDQIPQRAVRSGLIGRTGFIDPDLGGETRRLGITAQASLPNWQLGGYFLDYDFALFSNFTYLLDDPLLGDEFSKGRPPLRYRHVDSWRHPRPTGRPAGDLSLGRRAACRRYRRGRTAPHPCPNPYGHPAAGSPERTFARRIRRSGSEPDGAAARGAWAARRLLRLGRVGAAS